MVPSVEYNEESIAGKSRSPAHRYYTRSSRAQEPQSESRHPNERGKHGTTHQTTRKPVKLPMRQPQPSLLDSPSNAENESDAQDLDSSQLDSMMDQVVYSTSNPIRAPFPSPAMKFTQPFNPSAPTQQGNQFAYSEGGWGGQHENNGSWHQTGVGGAGGQCILVEAANRAQMAILMDDMGNMGIEQMEQT